jgi:hypothetical protein
MITAMTSEILPLRGHLMWYLIIRVWALSPGPSFRAQLRITRCLESLVILLDTCITAVTTGSVVVLIVQQATSGASHS